MKTQKEVLDKIEQKLDDILLSLQAIKETLAKNEVEHCNFEKRLESLENKKGQGTITIAWITSIVSIILTFINILNFIKK